MWTDGWRDHAPHYEGGPSRWWHSTHSSGYEVGEVDGGRYMVCDDHKHGVFDETGDYVAFTNPDAAKLYVEELLRNRGK